MKARYAFLLVAVLAPAMAGCHAPPSELFSWIDRNCFVADWTNHQSHVSCCCCQNGSCHHPGTPPMPMLALGDARPHEAEPPTMR